MEDEKEQLTRRIERSRARVGERADLSRHLEIAAAYRRAIERQQEHEAHKQEQNETVSSDGGGCKTPFAYVGPPASHPPGQFAASSHRASRESPPAPHQRGGARAGARKSARNARKMQGAAALRLESDEANFLWHENRRRSRRIATSSRRRCQKTRRSHAPPLSAFSKFSRRKVLHPKI